MTGPSSTNPPAVNAPLRDIADWTAFFRDTPIPVLQETADTIERLRENQEFVDANSLGELIASDPLMTLKVLAYASEHRGSRVVTDVETVTAALVLMGISPFFEAFGPQPTVESLLQDQPEAVEGLYRVLDRAHRGATFALAFAVHRMSPDAAVIHAVTLLHEFAELLLWCHAPTMALRIQHAQTADPSLRSSTAQHDVLNVTLPEIQEKLMRSWRLPELLSHLTDPELRETSAVKIIELSTRLARHTSHGWNNPALPDDIAEIAQLLNLSTAATLRFAQDVQ